MSKKTSRALQLLYTPIQAEMTALNALLNQHLLQLEYDSKIRHLNHYILSAPGKRLRPALVFFSKKLSQQSPSKLHDEDAVKIAAAIELIHMASLIHDDVIDHADSRHNQPTLHKQYGIESAIPSGVYLYATALQLIAETGNLHILRIISHAVKQLCRGELGQVGERGNWDITPTHYLISLKKKTGILFAAACHCGAILGNADKSHQFKLKQFGSTLGLVFQLLDDYMDIMGTETELKKQPGQDLLMGEATLPILILFTKVSESEKKEICEKLNKKQAGYLPEIQEKINKSGATVETQNLIKKYLKQAEELIDSYPRSIYKMACHQLLETIKKRAFN